VIDFSVVGNSFEELFSVSSLDEQSVVSNREELKICSSVGFCQCVIPTDVIELRGIPHGWWDRSCVGPVIDNIVAELSGNIADFISVKVFGVGVLI
jgi:hypothetical protein